MFETIVHEVSMDGFLYEKVSRRILVEMKSRSGGLELGMMECIKHKLVTMFVCTSAGMIEISYCKVCKHIIEPDNVMIVEAA